MSNGNLTISVDSHENFWARARAAAQALDRGELTEPVAHFSYENLETLMSILTPKRWALMRILRQRGPSSVRSLAGALGRDYKAVHGDVAALVEHGLIERQAKDRIAMLWDVVHADLKLAA